MDEEDWEDENDDWDEVRIDRIGQNGNDGLIYQENEYEISAILSRE